MQPDLTTNLQEIQETENMLNNNRGMQSAKSRLWKTLMVQITWFLQQTKSKKK